LTGLAIVVVTPKSSLAGYHRDELNSPVDSTQPYVLCPYQDAARCWEKPLSAICSMIGTIVTRLTHIFPAPFVYRGQGAVWPAVSFLGCGAGRFSGAFSGHAELPLARTACLCVRHRLCFVRTSLAFRPACPGIFRENIPLAQTRHPAFCESSYCSQGGGGLG
jgi:hypothetical protein